MSHLFRTLALALAVPAAIGGHPVLSGEDQGSPVCCRSASATIAGSSSPPTGGRFWLGDTAWELFHRLTREDAVYR